MNAQELADYFQTTIGTVKTNFPKLKQRALKKGFLITKRGKGENAIYEVEKVIPQDVPISELSTSPKIYWESDSPGEKWVTTYCDEEYEVSNFGRVRYKKDLSLRKASDYSAKGYKKVSIRNNNYSLHRLVLNSFNPIPNADQFQVDHIDGNRSNNSLDNLRWVTLEENIEFMLLNRKELNKELTRLLKKYTYEEVLQKLKEIE